MPIYRWTDGEVEVEVYRRLDERDQPPREEELPEGTPPGERSWKRMLDAPRLTNPNKGNW